MAIYRQSSDNNDTLKGQSNIKIPCTLHLIRHMYRSVCNRINCMVPIFSRFEM